MHSLTYPEAKQPAYGSVRYSWTYSKNPPALNVTRFFFFFGYRVSLAFSPSSFFFSIFNCLRRRLFVVSERSVAAVAFADECVLDCRSCVFVEKTKQNLPRNVLIGAGLCWCPRRLRSVLFCHSFCVGRASVAGQPSLCFLAVPLIRVTCFPQTNRTLAPTSSAHQEPNALLPLTPVQPPASAQPSKSWLFCTFNFALTVMFVFQVTSVLCKVGHIAL